MTHASYHQFLVSREVGGAALVGLHIADHLRRLRQPSQVWVPGPGPAEQEAGRLGLATADYDGRAILGPSPTRSLWGNWRLARRLRRAGAALVHVHTPVHYAALRWGLRWARVKRVVHVHLETDAEAVGWTVRIPPELIVTCASTFVDRVRQGLPRECQERQRIVAIPNAVDVERFAPGDKQAAKHKVGAPLDRPLVLMLANLAPHKGQETAIRAVALLKQRGAQVACWLAGVERGGSTAFTSRLQTLIAQQGVADRVQLLGQRSDAPDLLRAADFFLLPSTCEGLPLAILEAQASLVPVLAAPTAGIPEVIADGKTGFLIAADNAAAYADRLQTLLVQPQMAHEVARSARDQILASHTWPVYCQRMQDLYQEVLTSGGPPR
jgi:glycosyltransferase involved in cell wall biosynthesis